MELLRALKKYFGYDQFRSLQKEIIEDALAGRDVFVLMPTEARLASRRVSSALCRAGAVDVGRFLERALNWNIAQFAIDEAHYISEWGHDFRPEYRELQKLRKQEAFGHKSSPNIF